MPSARLTGFAEAPPFAGLVSAATLLDERADAPAERGVGKTSAAAAVANDAEAAVAGAASGAPAPLGFRTDAAEKPLMSERSFAKGIVGRGSDGGMVPLSAAIAGFAAPASAERVEAAAEAEEEALALASAAATGKEDAAFAAAAATMEAARGTSSPLLPHRARGSAAIVNIREGAAAAAAAAGGATAMTASAASDLATALAAPPIAAASAASIAAAAASKLSLSF